MPGYKKPIPRSKVAIVVRNVINSFMWVVILFLIVIFGALVFCRNEGWDFEQSFYFAAYTSSSVGYGDMALVKDSSIVFNIFYILVSVSLTGIAFEKLANLKVSPSIS
jgi:multisubunit Na+/H+ antiporter MnhB subunit